MPTLPSKTSFLHSDPSRFLLWANLGMSIIYFFVIAFLFPHGNEVLFWILIAGEVFHTWQALTYICTVWRLDHKPKRDDLFAPPVDVYITVCGEPVDIVEETALAAKAMDYPNHRVFLLNDGYVAKKDNWKDMEDMAVRIGVGCITRQTPGGAKAGNINNAMGVTDAPYIVIFDADHVPHDDFLARTMGYFVDERLAYVQTPQYYKNAYENAITLSAWEQQELFFGPICRGKNRFNSATMCGTNMVIRRQALDEVGGMCTESIAEDFVTGLFIHEKGWRSLYVPEVLAEGLAPEDFLSYTKQQFRWARGALDVIFRYNLLFRRGLSFIQKIQYMSSVSFFLSGVIVLMNAALPILFLFFGITPVRIDTMLLAIVFIPYIFTTIGLLSSTSNHRFSFRAVSFSMSSFWIHIQALWSALTGRKVTFSVTSKVGVQGNYVHLAAPHLIYIGLFVFGLFIALAREGVSSSVINNVAWAAFNIGVFMPYIFAAIPREAVSGFMMRHLYKIMFIPERTVNVASPVKLKVVSKGREGAVQRGT
ncbi:MAG: glycosyltransferase [bacterium]|nr:glycosyltransferase [bacterium]